jgi:pimeloyl-ACP methyl ester carboxylesterase
MEQGPTVNYPRARRPDRHRKVDAYGISIATYEWGEPDAPPLLLTHGGFDFAATFDLLAPLLADAGWRVVATDQRGHGNSEWTALYSWEADVRDLLAVMDSVTRDPMPLIGHSKGAYLLMQIADAAAHRVSHLVNLDGLPSANVNPDIADRERTRMRRSEIENWLDTRRRAAMSNRKPGTLDDLARRRMKLNPRLPYEWLRYIASIGARHDDDGWRWKLDPIIHWGGFGPWRPEWGVSRMHGLGMPFLGVMSTEAEPMGWHATPADVRSHLPLGGRLEAIADCGHFVHIEQPGTVAAMLIEFLGTP